uniref:Hint domain-containing protein n=1 Tax=Panagrolaimus sp. ES5 TaxID=591445 RepID=A0AC34FHA8_9BILA
ISNYGQLTLGCSKPTCLNFRSGDTSRFFNVDGVDDGFVTVPKKVHKSYDVVDETECDLKFEATKCFKDGEWVAGILPESNTSTSNHLSLRCCRNSAMKMAKFEKIVDITKNEIFEGGDVYEKGRLIAFDYISNIVKFENDKGINYELFINQVYCNLTFTLQQEKGTKSKKIETKKLFQAPLVETDIANIVDGEVIQNENQEISNSQQTLQELPNSNPVSSVQQQVNTNYQAPMPSSLQLQIQPTPLQQPFQSVPMQPTFYNPSLVQQPSNTYSSDTGYSCSSCSGCMSCSYLCFSGDTMVTTYNEIKKRMDELNVDDWILTVENNEYKYSQMKSWLHRKPKLMAEFVKFTLDDGRQLKMTKNHFIYIGDCQRK